MDCLPENVNTNDLNYNSPQPKKNKVFKKKPNESKDIRGLLWKAQEDQNSTFINIDYRKIKLFRSTLLK